MEYTKSEHHVWKKVLGNLWKVQSKYALPEYFGYFDKVGLSRHLPPDVKKINDLLNCYTDYGTVVVDGLLEPVVYFKYISEYKQPITTFLRTINNLEYTPDPDMVHEIVGHVPMLFNSYVARLNNMLAVASLTANTEQLKQLTQIYWYTIEFGLVEECGVKAYGAGLLSSYGELAHAFESPNVSWEEFNIDNIVTSEYSYDTMQNKLFVAKSFNQIIKEVDIWLNSGF